MYIQVKMDLEQIIELLEKERSNRFRLFIQAQKAFDEDDFQLCSGIILSGNGGVGSLNDLVLGQRRDEQGNFGWEDGYQELNDNFQALLCRLYEFSHRCLRGKSLPRYH